MVHGQVKNRENGMQITDVWEMFHWANSQNKECFAG